MLLIDLHDHIPRRVADPRVATAMKKMARTIMRERSPHVSMAEVIRDGERIKQNLSAKLGIAPQDVDDFLSRADEIMAEEEREQEEEKIQTGSPSTVTPSSTASPCLEEEVAIDNGDTDDTYDPDADEDHDNNNGIMHSFGWTGDDETCWDDFQSMCGSLRSLNKKANLAIVFSAAVALAIGVLGYSMAVRKC